MDGITYIVSEEMKATADYAIKEANERFGLNLDFSENSIVIFENLLDQVSQSLSRLPADERTRNNISQAANIWGSFLGEYMCVNWGGKWTFNGSDRLVYISNILFSPIHFVYQKITSHPEYSVEIYLNEMKRIIYTSEINTQQTQDVSKEIVQPLDQISIKQSKKSATIDKRLLFTLAGIGGILLVTAAFIIGYSIIKNGGISAFGFIASATSSNTNIPIEKTLITATSDFTDTPVPTVTVLPTHTPKPTITPQPSPTPYLTYTQRATSTRTNTQTPFVPTNTLAPRRTPTPVIYNPPDTPVPPSVPPPPTATEPEPVVLESCEIVPSTVPPDNNVPITFIAHFSTNIPGYGFDAVIDQIYPGQSGCSGSDNDGDGIAFCDGFSGSLPVGTTVDVTFSSSVGNCIASYRSQ